MDIEDIDPDVLYEKRLTFFLPKVISLDGKLYPPYHELFELLVDADLSVENTDMDGFIERLEAIESLKESNFVFPEESKIVLGAAGIYSSGFLPTERFDDNDKNNTRYRQYLVDGKAYEEKLGRRVETYRQSLAQDKGSSTRSTGHENQV